MPNIETSKQRLRREHEDCDRRNGDYRTHDVWRCKHGGIFEVYYVDRRWADAMELSRFWFPKRYKRAVKVLAEEQNA